MVYRTSAFGLLALALLVSGVSVSASQRMTGVRESQVNDGINSRRDTQLLAQANVNEDEWFEGTLQGCKRTGSSVQCAVAVRIKKDHNARVRCQEDNLTRLFDTSGNVYPCAKIKIGNQEAQSHLSLRFPQGTPVKVTLTFNNVPSQVNEFDTLEIVFWFWGSTSHQFLKFKNIKLPR
ncbi:hypothetical protein IQ223_16350 [Microcystis aeruginosa LEGE 00239]|uniref:hypothetical protein n=1 Tax=Microcystis aeruginosa TaxID=1126 RepID=UPI0018808353|nr:hypothetical protein [Microcystis aeruginosa]MBE9246023.1 hypothetical protein [Microcystis aeruginosa LEGE 00239]